MLSKKGFLLLAFVLLIVPFASLSAQDQPTISIALPSMMRGVIDESIFDAFESAHGVQVYVNYTDSDLGGSGADINSALDALAEYVAAADVLYVGAGEFNPYATRAGYLLDLSPLTSTDASLNSDDFFPAAWNSVQWDGGVWALPISVDADMLIYDPDAFDRAGLAYPNERWTIDDLSSAAKALTQYNADGSISVPGISTFGSTAELFRSLYGQNFFDASGNPRFADPALEAIMTTWQELVSGGYVGSTFTSGSSNQVPMRIMGSFGLAFGAPDNQMPPVAVALPGGSVGLSLSALAVSSGTQQPELAYALAAYLSNSLALANSPLGGFPARQSLVGAQPTAPSESGSSGGGIQFMSPASSPAARAALTGLLPRALTLIEQGYGSYINRALSSMSSDGIDAHTALQQAEAQAASDLQAASDRRASVSVVVATPPPPMVLQPGEIALNFGIQSNVQPIPNLDQWQQLAADFAAADPDVGIVNLDTSFDAAAGYAERNDCFTLASNAVPSLDASTILNLDPYLDADPNFDPNDVVGGLMAQLQKDNHIWAYPLNLQAQTLSYSVPIFQQAGVPLPNGTWTLDQFNDALQTLKAYLDKAPFVAHDLNGESLMMLIAAYGGVPIDYRTSPATLNFTDPATVDAIRQVLDLAKNGYITYQTLANAGGGFSIAVASGQDQPDAITSDIVAGFRRIAGGPGGGDDRRLVSYPGGTYTGASFSVGTGYISATAQNPDACYRWLSYIAQHVGVFGAMPARLSQINDPAMQATFGANASFYAAYAQLLQSPTTIVFPSAGANSSVGDFLTQFFLNRAFDNYVLHDADLDAELADAQTYATAFQQCVAALPPEDTIVGGIGRRGVNMGILDCATSIDSSFANLFPSR